MGNSHWRERGVDFWNQKTLTLPWIIFILASLLLLARLGIALFEYSLLARAALNFPFPLDYGEGPILDQTLRLADFENIYRSSFASPPYTVSAYPPLFQLIQVPLTWIVGPAFWYGRLLSILSAVSAAGLIGLILNALTKDRVAAALGGLTFLAFPYLLQGSLLNRVDALALALSLGGLYTTVRWARHRALWAAGLLFTGAAFTNPRFALVAPFAAFVWLWHLEQRREAFRLVGILAGSCLGLFLILNLLTGGGFTLNTVQANLTSFSWPTVTGYWINLYLSAGYLVIGCLIFIAIERLEEATRSWPLVAPYCLGAAFMTLTAGLPGSSANDLFEVAAALSLASGAFIAWAGQSYWLKAFLVFVLAVQINLLLDWSRQDFIPTLMNKMADTGEIRQLAQYVREAEGPVLADEFMGLIPLAGRRLYYQPFEYKQLQAANLWSEASLIYSIKREEFPVILLYEPPGWNAISTRWSQEVRNTIYAHYRLEDILARTLVYRPKSGPP